MKLPEKLSALATIIARKQLAISLNCSRSSSGEHEAQEARAVIAGLLAAINTFVSDYQFEIFVRANDIDGDLLRRCHEIVYSDAHTSSEEPQRGSVIPAQGCDEGATLGSTPPNPANPEGVEPPTIDI